MSLVSRREARRILENDLSKSFSMLDIGWHPLLQYAFLLLAVDVEPDERGPRAKLILELDEYPILRTIQHNEKRHLSHTYLQWVPLASAIQEATGFMNKTWSTLDNDI
jgi:hypothetical protein